MKVTATPTHTVLTVDGVKCRVWVAETDTGIRFAMLVHRVSVPEEHAAQFHENYRTEFALDLVAAAAPTEVQAGGDPRLN